ncbi:MAG TPA: dipeptidase PepE [Burkholderiales bacterium]|nr:dipeptidase PepE [Burkholderiales bacterium]
MQLLLLSSSRTPAGYLTDYLEDIKAFSAGVRCARFVPFAAVALPWEEYAKRVSDASGIALEIAHRAGDLDGCDLVVVGGGNTFQLLRECRARGVLEAIRTRVNEGRTRYLGWSAGANLACPTIKTTNDMPIVDPGSLDALGLVRFQINPHYVNARLPGHHGETRDERLAEFARVNPQLPVLALPEGAWLLVVDFTVELRGPYPAVLFAGEGPPRKVLPGRLPPNFGDSA